MSSRRVRIFGIPIDALDREQVLERLTNIIAAKLPTQVVTVNPEFLVRSRSDEDFRRVLKSAPVSVADGIGVRAAATYQSLALPSWQPARLLVSLLQGAGMKLAILTRDVSLTRPLSATVTGVDLIEQLAERGERSGWRFYLLGGDPGVAQATAAALRDKYPKLIILGAEEGIPAGRYSDETLRTHVATRIGQTRPDVVLVAFGAPKQDLFIAQQLERLRAPIQMGVGGAFDFIAGRIPRAPTFLRSVGLEWLWRLIQEPRRFARIWTAVVVFPWLVFLERQRR